MLAQSWVEFSKCMRSAGVQVEALIEYVDLFFKEGTEEARKDILVEQRARLQEQYEQLKATMERLDYKIDQYSNPLHFFMTTHAYDSLTNLPVICSGTKARHCTRGRACFSSFSR